MKLVDLELLLPENIPDGEQVLWYGRPQWVSLARRAFRADLIAIYFIIFSAWNLVAISQEDGLANGITAAARTAFAGIICLAIVYLLAWVSARTTLYVITSKRLVMKISMALPVFFNIPFNLIESASLCRYSDGTGEIPVTLARPNRIAYLQLWPHARPFHFRQPQPALRSIADGERVAELLANALAAATKGSSSEVDSDEVGRIRDTEIVPFPHRRAAAA